MVILEACVHDTTYVDYPPLQPSSNIEHGVHPNISVKHRSKHAYLIHLIVPVTVGIDALSDTRFVAVDMEDASHFQYHDLAHLQTMYGLQLL